MPCPVRPGDLALSRDEHIGVQSCKRVERTIVHQASELVHVRTSSDTITATPNHSFWVRGRGWVDAGALVSGDTFVLADGGRVVVRASDAIASDSWVVVSSIQSERSRPS